MSNNRIFTLTPITDVQGFSGRAALAARDGSLEATFTGGNDSHVLRFQLPEKVTAAGVSARIRLMGWESISYAAIGYSKLAGYRHIKAKNIRQGAWVDLGFTHQDLIWQLQNGSAPAPDTEIKDIRLFIKGKPAAAGAILEIASLSVLAQPAIIDLPEQRPLPDDLLDVLYGYLQRSFRDYAHNASEFMQTGKCPMPGKTMLDWSPDASRPENLESVNTYRFSWHGLHPAIHLLLQARETGEIGPVFAARSFIEAWLEQSFYTPDEDIKFAWYDHGTAERLLALIIMWAKGIELKFDQRFMQRLALAMTKHAELLNSEAFYAYNQPLRYHNHAWFQDAALIAAAIAFAGHGPAQTWRDNAIARFEDQLDKLIVRDGGFAIFVENSIGYHHGVQRLAEFVGELVALSGKKTEIPTIAQELVAWSDFLRYPDGRAPAQGDTFRLPPRTGKDVRRGEPWENPSCTILPKAGYAVVKGNHDGKPWMLCLFNTSLSKTHKHEDNLSITLWFDGVEWLIDPSFYSHEYAEKTSSYLRSAKAHNRIFCENARYSIEPGNTQLQGMSSELSVDIAANSFCVEGLEMRRSIAGGFDKLALEFDDAVSALDGGIVTGAGLSYVFGEQVVFEPLENGFALSHPDSTYKLFFDFTDKAYIEGVNTQTGLGFMQASAVYGAIVDFPVSSQLSWRLSAQCELLANSLTPPPSNNTLENYNLGKVLVIGSCVSRDALSLMRCEEIKYYARTGFISLASAPVMLDEQLLEFDGLGNFEKRMILADFDKRAIDDIENGDFDVVILDFIDERFDLSEFPGKGLVTRSNYLIQSGLLEAVGDRVRNRFTLDEDWERACEKISKMLRGKKHRIVLHKAWWAECFYNHDTGLVERFKDDQLVVVNKYNGLLGRYYSVLEANIPELLVVQVDKSLIYSDYAHKWGRDYFHYGSKYYAKLAREICKVVTSK